MAERSWIADLAGALPVRRERGVATVSIPVVARECELWSFRAPRSAWDRKDNAASLLADWDAAVDDTGPAVRRLLGRSADRLASCLREVVSASKSDRPTKVPALGAAAREVLSQLAKPETRVAAWADVVEAARAAGSSATVVGHRVALLHALVDLGRVDPDDVTSRMRLQLAPPAGLEDLPGLPPADAGDDERIAACKDIVEAEPRTGRCVVWLSYEDARLHQGQQDVGPVFLIETDWAVPNAVNEKGQAFPHRDELIRLLDHLPEIRDRDFSVRRFYEVLVRVDLGDRSPYRALDDAEEMIKVVLGVVVNRSGAPSWHRGELSGLLLDGNVILTGLGPYGRSHRNEVDHYGQNGAAEALAQYGPELGRLLSTGPLPEELREALRLIGEAGQIDSREHSLYSTATITEQTAVVLQASAVEHIAAFGKVSDVDHDNALLVGWPMARWRRRVANSVTEGLRGLRGGDNPVSKDVAPAGLGGTISLEAAYRHRDVLVGAIRRRLHRPEAARLIGSIGDAATCAELLVMLENEATLVNQRLRRCRNALVHGNPVTTESVASVRGLSRYKANSALELAIRSAADGTTLGQLLAERSQHNEEHTTRIKAGTAPLAIWTQR